MNDWMDNMIQLWSDMIYFAISWFSLVKSPSVATWLNFAKNLCKSAFVSLLRFAVSLSALAIDIRCCAIFLANFLNSSCSITSMQL